VAEKKRQYGRGFQLQGAAAVWQAASQLALREHNPLFPGLDEGYDLQINNGLRLQVKSATIQYRSSVNYPLGAYCFGLRRGAWDGSKKAYTRSNLRSYSEVADFFVLWGIDENRFFILPTSYEGKAIWFSRRGFESKSHNRRVFAERTERRLADYEDRWDLLDVNRTSSDLIESAVDSIEEKKEQNKV
jgi:hypothetical protein